MKHQIILMLALFISIALGVSSVINSSWSRKFWYVLRHRKQPTLQPIGIPEFKCNGNYRNIIFLHHSTGRNLIRERKVREILTEKGYFFWDHDYNSIGLTDPSGVRLNLCYDIPSDRTDKRGNGNTNPDGLAILFDQPVHNPPDNAFSRLLQHEVIIFKSCFPNSAIKSDQMLDQYKKWLLGIRKIIDQHPDKIFIPFTLPPLHPLATNIEEANRARKFADWLKSSEYLAGHPNIYVFDLFDLLADSSTNMLRLDFQRNSNNRDSHPNRKANRTIGPILVDFIDTVITNYCEKNIKWVSSSTHKKDNIIIPQDKTPPSRPQNLESEFVFQE